MWHVKPFYHYYYKVLQTASTSVQQRANLCFRVSSFFPLYFWVSNHTHPPKKKIHNFAEVSILYRGGNSSDGVLHPTIHSHDQAGS